MRIARVLQEETTEPTLGLERDGALYSVGELDRAFQTPFSPDEHPGSASFHHRVVALGCAGLDLLDDRLRAGDRPTAARILPGTFVWLPPCDPDRAYHVRLPRAAGSSHHLGSARAFTGHDASVSFPGGETRPGFELGLAVMLGEDLRSASPEDAERAILGYAILNDWTARDEEARCPARARDFSPQLGPVLVTKDEVHAPARLRTRARVDGEVAGTSELGPRVALLARSIAETSRWVELRAGDVVSTACSIEGADGASGRPLSFHSPVELTVERLGRLTGRPMPGSW